MYRNPPVYLFINFQMSKLENYSEEYADHSLDNLEELQEQGWIPGQPCSILVDEHGDLGPCLPLPSININHLLLGLGIITLLICWTFYYSKRIYRCKSLPHLTQLSYFPSTKVLFLRKKIFFLSCLQVTTRRDIATLPPAPRARYRKRPISTIATGTGSVAINIQSPSPTIPLQQSPPPPPSNSLLDIKLAGLPLFLNLCQSIMSLS